MFFNDSDLKSFPDTVLKGDLDSVKKILERRGERIKVIHGSSLCLAAQKRRNDIVRLLLEFGFDANLKDAKGNLPVFYSVERNDKETTELLLQSKGQNNNQSDFDNLLFLACRKGFANIVEVLLNFGANVNARDEYGQTSLHHAILLDSAVFTFLKETGIVNLNGMESVVKILLSKGADVNAKTVNGFSPLHFSIERKYHPVIYSLIDHGADFNTLIDHDIISPKIAEFRTGKKSQRNMDFRRVSLSPRFTSVLHLAAESNDIPVMKKLLNAGASVDAVQHDGQTPLVLAIKRRCKKAVKLLLEYGADIEQKNKYGLTPLHVSCRNGSINVLSSLLEAGADINATCSKNRVPYSYVLLREEEVKCEYMFMDNVMVDTGHRYFWYNQHYMNCIKIKETLLSQLNMMALSNVYLRPYNKDLVRGTPIALQKVSKEELKEFSTSFMICNNVPLYVVTSEVRKPYYIRNPTFLKGLDKAIPIINSRYPTLGNVLKLLVRKASLRIELIDKGIEWFMYLNEHNEYLPKLPSEILETIVSFLPDEDIQNVIKCGERLSRVKMIRLLD